MTEEFDYLLREVYCWHEVTEEFDSLLRGGSHSEEFEKDTEQTITHSSIAE